MLFKPTRLDHGTPNSLPHVVGSCHIDVMMPTAVAIGEAEGGFEIRHYELNWRRDQSGLV